MTQHTGHDEDVILSRFEVEDLISDLRLNGNEGFAGRLQAMLDAQGSEWKKADKPVEPAESKRP